jgi:hypothetical protein
MKKLFVSPLDLFNKSSVCANLQAMRSKGAITGVLYEQRRLALLVQFTKALP